MKGLRMSPPSGLAGLKVLGVRDYLCSERTDAKGNRSRLDLPKSDVLYFELEGGAWVCIRPSGTEPKIKLYVNTTAKDMEEAQELNAKLREASEALMK